MKNKQLPWVMLAAEHYQTSSGFVAEDDFFRDMQRFRIIARLAGCFAGEKDKRNINIRALLNQVVILSNVLPSHIIVAIFNHICSEQSARPVNSLLRALQLTDGGETDEAMDAALQKVLHSA